VPAAIGSLSLLVERVELIISKENAKLSGYTMIKRRGP